MAEAVASVYIWTMKGLVQSAIRWKNVIPYPIDLSFFFSRQNLLNMDDMEQIFFSEPELDQVEFY